MTLNHIAMNYTSLRKLFGTRADHAEQARIAFLMILVTALYEVVSLYFLPEYHFNTYEFLGTWTGLVCVWLTRTRNVLCWPWGILSSLFLGIFFKEIGLPGQMWLNLGYFMVIQVWSWPYWVWGGKEKTELPVTSLTVSERLVALGLLTLGMYATYMLIGFFVPGSLYPWLDATVVASSVVAQFLLGRKKVESWVMWLGPVNLLSIVLFYLSGAYTLTALYIAFFIHAACALRTWAQANSHYHV